MTGSVNGRFNLTGSLDDPTVYGIAANGTAELNSAGGKIRANKVQLAQGQWQANITANDINLTQLIPLPVPTAISTNPISGRFNLKGSLDDLTIAGITGEGEGSLNLAGGKLLAKKLKLVNSQWSGTFWADKIQIRQLNHEIPSQLDGPINGTFFVAGNLEQLRTDNITANGTASLNLAGGEVKLTDVEIDRGKFKAVVTSLGVGLKQFSEKLQGTIASKLDVAGSLNLNPGSIVAQGELKFSQGIAPIDGPLTTQINWNGRRLAIDSATAPGILDAKGFVDLNLASRGIEAIEQFNFDIKASKINLKALPIENSTLPWDGYASFDGTIAGTPVAPQINGDIALEQFTVGELVFDPILSGKVNTRPGQEITLQLEGKTDLLSATLAPNYTPKSFSLNVDETRASGDILGEKLNLTVKNIPLILLKELAVALPLKQNMSQELLAKKLSGKLSGEAVIDLNNGGTTSEIKVTDPIFGNIFADLLTAEINYRDDTLILKEGQLQKDKSLYQFNGSLKHTPNGPESQAELNITQADIQDVLVALELFELSDLGRPKGDRQQTTKADLYSKTTSQEARGELFSIGFKKDETIQTQLRRISEIKTWLSAQQQKRSSYASIPELRELIGTFDGNVTFSASPKSGISAQFNFTEPKKQTSSGWQWGPYRAKQVEVRGQFR